MKPVLPFVLVLLVAGFSVSAQQAIVTTSLIDPKGILITASDMYAAPDSASKVVGRLPAHTWIYLLESDSLGYMLVGSSEEQALGYLPSESIQRWDHRICLQFNRITDRLPGLFYRQKQEVEEVLKERPEYDSKGLPNDLAVGMEDMLNSSASGSYFLPVLDQYRAPFGGRIRKAYWVSFAFAPEAWRIGPFLAKRKAVEIAHFTMMSACIATTYSPVVILLWSKYLMLHDNNPNNDLNLPNAWLTSYNSAEVSQTIPYVYITHDEFDVALTRLKALSEDSPALGLGEVISVVIEILSGENMPGDLIEDDLFQKVVALPENTELLKLTDDERARMGERSRKDLWEYVQTKISLLNTHREKPANWHTIPDTELQYTLIPLSIVP